ncbi:MAG: DUF309 domain-containing protein [Sulfurimonas sp.]|nr:DUF309 domain-containing protein [Sulfurimonas sp.]MBU1216586.1 DUF309 domain-containing protein [bacterium]MBU1433595.1 DUF309 domain-containing protein [bacterium]MBU1503224.1 DUF309 domain-containing protein [bacterium]MBU3938447.1 DUF309 domain-containing protein [bacterium]
MLSKHEKLLEEFMLCLNEKRYYDAHEALEEIWFPRRFEKDEEVFLLKGFINAAVSFELIKLGRENPSKKAWSTYLKYRPLLYRITSPYKNSYHFISRHIDTLYHSKAL